MTTSRRDLLKAVTAAGLTVTGVPALAQAMVDLGLPGGPSARPLSSAFPQKAEMIVQRVNPPLLETPMAVFDDGVFTPNDRFYVRWHWADIPTSIDVFGYRLKVRGHVERPQALSLGALADLPRHEIAAVNQCSGNSRGLFEPRIAGAQWRHGSMGNARWQGVRLRDVLDRAGVRRGAVAVRFNGMDKPLTVGAPDFAKSLMIDHARSDEVLLAFAMNGEQLPLLNGFPLRLVVPGWYSTYWVKMVDDIEVLDVADDSYWMAKAYKIPATPHANVRPGDTDYPKASIGRMIPRSFITNIADRASVAFRPEIEVRGIAMGGDSGVSRVEISADGGQRWQMATLGEDMGTHSFRRFGAVVKLPGRGDMTLMARAMNRNGVRQPLTANWNPNGFMRGVTEKTRLTVV